MNALITNTASTDINDTQEESLVVREAQLRSDWQGIAPFLSDTVGVRDYLPRLTASFLTVFTSLDAIGLVRSFKRVGIEGIPEEEAELILRLCKKLSPDGGPTKDMLFRLHELERPTDSWISMEVAQVLLDYAEDDPLGCGKILAAYYDFTISDDECPSLAQGIIRAANDLEICDRLICLAWLDETSQKLTTCCNDVLSALMKTFSEDFEKDPATEDSEPDDRSSRLRCWRDQLNECFRMTWDIEQDLPSFVQERDFSDLFAKKCVMKYVTSLRDEVSASR